MKKFRIALTLVVAILCVASMAMAASVPSKSTADLAKVTAITNATGTAVPTIVTLPVAEESSATATELAAIAAAVQGGADVASYFGDDAKTQMAALLPAGFDQTALVMNEFVDVDVSSYLPEYGNLAITFEFATIYNEGDTIVAMVGIPENGTVTWYAQAAEVVNGAVKITFTADVLSKMQENGHAMIAILNGTAG